MPTTATTATPAPTEATTATPAPTDTPTTAKCTAKDLRSSTGRRDLPTQQYSKKCDEPTITRSKLPKKRPAPCARSLSQSTKLPLAETVLMMSARKKTKYRVRAFPKNKKKKKKRKRNSKKKKKKKKKKKS